MAGSLRAWATPPEIGARAPQLKFDEVLQLPPGTKLDWAALRGKTVVLEFWATWCAPCVEGIPHLNRLAASVPSSKVVFISVDDESVDTVKRFSSRRQMNTILGVDTSGKTLEAYGVSTRPTTVVVDGAGRIAAVTTPEKLDAATLLKYAAATPAKRVPAQQVAAAHAPEVPKAALPAAVSGAVAPVHEQKPLFGISITPVQPRPDNSFSMMHDDAGNYTFDGVPANFVLTTSYNYPLRRFEFIDPLPEGAFRFAVTTNGVDPGVKEQMLRSAVAAAFGMDIDEVRQHRQVLVLHAPHPDQLTQTASEATPSVCGIHEGRLALINCSTHGLANYLEDRFGATVVDGTNLSNHYDADVALPAQADLPAMKAALQGLGLELKEEEATYSSFRVHKAGPGEAGRTGEGAAG